jgi:hypothetical protein
MLQVSPAHAGVGKVASWQVVVIDATVSFNRGSASPVDDCYKPQPIGFSAAVKPR